MTAVVLRKKCSLNSGPAVEGAFNASLFDQSECFYLGGWLVA